MALLEPNLFRLLLLAPRQLLIYGNDAGLRVCKQARGTIHVAKDEWMIDWVDVVVEQASRKSIGTRDDH
jgi:hypothetical protein